MEFGKVFRFLASKLRQACQNFIAHVRRTFWGETTLLVRRPKFSPFAEFEQTVFRILTGIFRQGGHNRILRAQMKFFLFFEGDKWRKNYFFLKVAHCYHFQTLCEKIFSTFAGMVTQACQKIVVHVQTKIFTKNIFGGLIIFSSFPEIQQNFSEFWREIFGRVVTTTFIHVHRNILRKVIFLSKSSKFFFVVFWIWAADVWTLRENFLLPLSRLHSPLLKNHFWWTK